MILTDNQITNLIKCSAGLISNDELESEINKTLKHSEFINLLNSVYESQNESLFEAVLWCMPNNLTDSELEHLYSEFIVLKGHREHESITQQFQLKFNDNKDNIKHLLSALAEIPDYLSFDDFKYSYIRKIVYAIGAQPEPFNIEALECLAQENSNDDQIKDLVLHQIKKRKDLGRWEFKKNKESQS